MFVISMSFLFLIAREGESRFWAFIVGVKKGQSDFISDNSYRNFDATSGEISHNPNGHWFLLQSVHSKKTSFITKNQWNYPYSSSFK